MLGLTTLAVSENDIILYYAEYSERLLKKFSFRVFFDLFDPRNVIKYGSM